MPRLVLSITAADGKAQTERRKKILSKAMLSSSAISLPQPTPLEQGAGKVPRYLEYPESEIRKIASLTSRSNC